MIQRENVCIFSWYMNIKVSCDKYWGKIMERKFICDFRVER